MAKTEQDDGTSMIARNKRARHDYHILQTWEAGLVLRGTEVKSLRDGKANLTDAYAIIKDGEIHLLNLHIAGYAHGNQFNHEPTRTRKLLLHAAEIMKLIGKVERAGYALVPLDLHYARGRIKLEIGLAKGKKQYDKRADEQEKDSKREAQRAVKEEKR